MGTTLCVAHADELSAPDLSNGFSGQDNQAFALRNEGTADVQVKDGASDDKGSLDAHAPVSPNAVTSSKSAEPADKNTLSSQILSVKNPQIDEPKAEASTQQKPVNKPGQAGWMKDSDGTWYFFANANARPSTGWINYYGMWYWLQPEANGAMAASKWVDVDGKEYYLTSSGAMATGWVKNGGKWNYANASGAKVKGGWTRPDGVRWYWIETDGVMAEAKWINNNGADYYLSGSGVMATGWVNDGGKWFFTNASGAKVKGGWIRPDGVRWYWLDSADDGAMAVRKWVLDRDNKYYVNDWGHMLTGWVNDGGKWFFTNASGAKVKGGWIRPDGVRWYWLDSADDGAMIANSLKTIDGKQYSFESSGAMRAHCQIDLGDKVAGYAADSGAISRIGVFDENGKLVLTDEKGKAISGWHSVAGQWFYGTVKTGVAHTGWLLIGSTWYYMDNGGAMVTGNRTIDGTVNIFDGFGRWIGASVYATRAQGYSSGTNRLILVDRGNHKVVVFNGRQGNWNLEHEWSCVTGAPGTPTITGTFRTTGHKTGSLTTDSRAHYCTQIAGGYFFHTILASDGELGQSLSHGCIRLAYPNAQWIYNNIGAGTTVSIFN